MKYISTFGSFKSDSFGQYLECKLCYPDFSIFSIVSTIEQLTLEGHVFDSLNPFVNNKNLRTIKLVTTKIENISLLTTFNHLEEIEIDHSGINDLHELIHCPSLKKLSLPIGTNTGVFPHDVQFQITMI